MFFFFINNNKKGGKENEKKKSLNDDFFPPELIVLPRFLILERNAYVQASKSQISWRFFFLFFDVVEELILTRLITFIFTEIWYTTTTIHFVDPSIDPYSRGEYKQQTRTGGVIEIQIMINRLHCNSRTTAFILADI